MAKIPRECLFGESSYEVASLDSSRLPGQGHVLVSTAKQWEPRLQHLRFTDAPRVLLPSFPPRPAPLLLLCQSPAFRLPADMVHFANLQFHAAFVALAT